MTLARSVLAVVVGIATFSVLLVAMMRAGTAVLGAEPEWINRSLTTQVVWLFWNIVSMAAAGYAAAWMAPKARVAHACAMAAIQAALTLAAFLTVTDNDTPVWLWIAGMVSNVPAAWAGAAFGSRRAMRALQ